MTDSPSSSSGLPHSPHAMAEAVLTQALQKRGETSLKRANDTTTDDDDDVHADPPHKRVCLTTLPRENANPNMTRPCSLDNDDAALLDQLHRIWSAPPCTNDNNDDGSSLPTRTARTVEWLQSHMDSLVRLGLEAFYECDVKTRTLTQLQDKLDATERELQRLKASEEQSRLTITNLLRAVETSQSNTRDASRSIQLHAKLRAEVTHLGTERHNVLAQAATHLRQVELLQQELTSLKSKHHKLAQDKIKLERDSRAAISLARSMDTHVSSDLDFYKRKVSELTGHLQTQQALVAEQKHQMDEMRRQMERSMSHTRLAHMRAESHGGNKQGRQRVE